MDLNTIQLSSNNNRGLNESIQEREKVKVSDITNSEAGQFYGLIAEGNPREFLKTQFIAEEIKSNYAISDKVDDSIIMSNYNKIVRESKLILEA